MKDIRTQVAKCPVCNKRRVLQTSKVVSRKADSVTVYNKCPHCASAFLAIISRKNITGAMVAIETLTDLSYQEAVRVINNDPLSIDAVLEIYQTMYPDYKMKSEINNHKSAELRVKKVK